MNFIIRNVFPVSSQILKPHCLQNYFKHSTTLLIKRNLAVPVKSVIEVNTNVVKDVILFKYENPKFFKMMNIFAITQYVFWTYLGYFAYTTLKDIPVDPEVLKNDQTRWYQKVNLGDNKYRNGLGIISLVMGFVTLSGAWTYTLRSVRMLVLHKGGKSVTFVIYTPFGHNRLMKVDLKHVSCQQTRHECKVQLPLKVQNKYLHYMLDMRGEFRNLTLFDHTAGLKRIFK